MGKIRGDSRFFPYLYQFSLVLPLKKKKKNSTTFHPPINPAPLHSPDAISTLKRAARRAWAVPASETLAAILVLEKAKLVPDGGGGSDPAAWLQAIAGGPQGRRWRLMFTSGTDQVRKAVAGGRSGGVYIPITAVQRWRLADGLIENGVYLGFLGALVFSGRWESKGRRLSFDFDSVRLRVGPWSRDFAVRGKKAGEEEEAKGGKKSLGPFFLFAYADDDICVARGRSGGVALWARASGDWQVKAGIDA